MIEATHDLGIADDGGDADFYRTLSASKKDIRGGAKMERAVTMKMVADTKLKNLVDQTTGCFETPGFLEVMGVDEVYLSHTKRAFSPPGGRKKPPRSWSTGALPVSGKPAL